MNSECILYLGRFEMPDKDATANRVLSNGKILRDLGYKVVFVGWNTSMPWTRGIDAALARYDDFECWELARPRRIAEHFFAMTDAGRVDKIMSQYDNIKILIAYNYPSIALSRIHKLCQKKNIKCVADITEWYGEGSKGLLMEAAKAFDTAYRMKVLHKKLDGHIVISKFLRNYYSACNIETIILPPLVDLSDQKWNVKKNIKKNSSYVTLVYAGKPSFTKERLDLVVRALISVHNDVDMRLKVIGIGKQEFFEIYPPQTQNDYEGIDDVVTFLGEISHKQAISNVKRADYSLVIREQNRVTQAGFPTKLVESISCGTPVITTDNSDVKEYIINGENGYVISLDNIQGELLEIYERDICAGFDHTVFDYRNYVAKTEKFINHILAAD